MTKPDSQDANRQSADRDNARKFRAALSPELLLRWLVIRDGPFLPNGRFVGLITAPAQCEPTVLQTAKRIIQPWPARFMLPAQSDSERANLPGLVLRSLALAGIVQNALVAVPSNKCTEWKRRLDSGFQLIPTLTKTAAIAAKYSSKGQALALVPTESLTITNLGNPPNERPRWDIVFVDGTTASPSMEVLEEIRDQSKALLIAAETNPSDERVLSLMRLCRRSGSFSLDNGIAREFYQLIAKFENLEGRLRLQDTQLLTRAVTEIEKLDPDYWHEMLVTLDARREAILTRWIRTGCALTPGEVSTILYTLWLAAPLSRIMAIFGSGTPDPFERKSDKHAVEQIPAPVSMDDISETIRKTARKDGILRPTGHPEVFAVDDDSGKAIRITASRDIFETENRPSSRNSSKSRCEFASYGGPTFDYLLALLPAANELPNWLRKVEATATDGTVTISRTAYVASCKDGDRTILSVRALNGAEINPDGEPSEAFTASLERYLRQETRSELARIRRIARIEKDNLKAANRQRAFALEIAAALLQDADTDEENTSTHGKLAVFDGRKQPMLVTLDRARLYRHSPNLSDLSLAIPDEGKLCISVPPAIIQASLSEAATMQSEHNAEIDSEQLRQEVNHLLESIDG